MEPDKIISELSKHIDNSLATDLVNEFLEIRTDLLTSTFSRASSGKFIETVVQILQLLETGKFPAKPKVDAYLKNLESRTTPLNDDLKICCSRIARSCYTLRNKRNILHKGFIDPNIYDLKYIYACAQWILTEIVRQVLKTDISTAGKLIEFIQIPVHLIMEDFGDRRIIYGNLTVSEEILVLLHSYYPVYIVLKTIQNSMDRRSKSAISNSLSRLWKDKLVHKSSEGYKLTAGGYKASIEIVKAKS